MAFNLKILRMFTFFLLIMKPLLPTNGKLTEEYIFPPNFVTCFCILIYFPNTNTLCPPLIYFVVRKCDSPLTLKRSGSRDEPVLGHLIAHVHSFFIFL